MRTNDLLAADRALDEFERAERRTFDRYGVVTEPCFVDLPGGDRARVLIAGEGPPVVLVIGGGMVAAMWAPLLPYLDGSTTYLVDPPGAGLSDPVGYRRGELRTTAVGFLDGVFDGLGLDRAHLVGHSMGGLWSTWFALDRPDRVGAISHVGCPALVLGTSAPLPMRLSTITPLHRLVSLLDPPSPKQVDRAAHMAGEHLDDLPEIRDLFVAAGRLPHAGTHLHQLLRAAIGVRGARADAALGADELRRLRRPLQVIWGADDTFGSPAIGRQMIDIVPHGELHTVAGGHAPWFSHADEVGPPLADFVADHRTFSDRHRGRVADTREEAPTS
jgi:pimeloyl-ACP methyl ester carboxylesterase